MSFYLGSEGAQSGQSRGWEINFHPPWNPSPIPHFEIQVGSTIPIPAMPPFYRVNVMNDSYSGFRFPNLGGKYTIRFVLIEVIKVLAECDIVGVGNSCSWNGGEELDLASFAIVI